MVSSTNIKEIDHFGYFGVSLSQSNTIENIEWSKSSVVQVLGLVGAQVFSLLAIVRGILAHYTVFNYHMTALKTLYFEEGSRRNDKTMGQRLRDDLSNQLKRLRQFDFSYWSQMLALFIGCFCCCCDT